MIGQRKKAATINCLKANPMAEMEGLVMWIPDHADQTVTLRVSRHLSSSFRVQRKKSYYVTVCNYI